MQNDNGYVGVSPEHQNRSGLDVPVNTQSPAPTRESEPVVYGESTSNAGDVVITDVKQPMTTSDAGLAGLDLGVVTLGDQPDGAPTE